MARCPNKNTVEYKALQEVYKTELKTNNVINAWQSANNTDMFPTTVEAASFIKTNKAAFSLKQRDFGKSVIENLRRKKLIHLYKGNWVVKNSYDNSWVYDAKALSDNYKSILKYLEVNNIPTETVDINRTESKKTYTVKVLDNLFTPKDMLESSRDWDKPRSREVVSHLKRMFPKLKIEMLSAKEAEKKHALLPKWKKKSGPFAEVNSFVFDDVVYLIEGRTTNETLIEEMLHPFIDAIKIDNETLFNNLLAEAKINFPVMVQQITDAYNDNKNFTQVDRNLEIVTQALTRHFNNEYDGVKPSKTFLDLIKEALEWLSGVVNNLHKYMTGNPLPVIDINSNATFTDIAKLLNTKDLKFELGKSALPKVKYSLSPKIQSIKDRQLSIANPTQAVIINELTRVASDSTVVIDTLSVNINSTNLKPGEKASKVTMKFNEGEHTYVDINSNTAYTSATTAIKGKFTNKEGEAIIARDNSIKGLDGKALSDAKKEWAKKIKKAKEADAVFLKERQFNLDLGNDVDIITEAIVIELNGKENLSLFADTLPKMKVLTRDQTLEMFGAMREIVRNLMPDGSIAMSQVVLFDEATKLAGTADLLIITEDGGISILDLKTSKNSLFKTFSTDTKEGRQGLTLYDSKNWTLPADSLLKQKGVDFLSTKGQHNLQVNLYRRMLENMGYTVNDGAFSATTFHILLDVEGKGTEQKYKGTFTNEGYQHHNSEATTTELSANEKYVNMLIPANEISINRQKIKDKISNTENAPYKGKDDELAQEQDEIIEQIVEPKVISPKPGMYSALERYSKAIEASQEIDNSNKKKVFFGKTFEQRRNARAEELLYIQTGMNKGPVEQSKVYTAVLRKSLERIREFTTYVENPKNINDPNYIGYVLNFNRFIATFKPLFNITFTKELNSTQANFVLNLKEEVLKLAGEELKVGREGLVNDAVFNWVKEKVKQTSKRQYGVEGSGFTDEDLIKDLTKVKDIDTLTLGTSDLDGSKDVLSALVAKIYKRQMQILLDKIEFRESVIKKAGNKVLKLSPEKNKENAYDFMHVFDSEGKRTGLYVKPIGKKYYTLSEKIRLASRDEDGVPLQYRDVSNLADASDEDIAKNIEIANKKRAASEFFQAERSDENGNRIDGKYHKYNKEFMDARNKFEFWQNNGTYGTWHKKSNITGVADIEYQKYRAKYYNTFDDYTKAIYSKGKPTGQISKNEKRSFVKKEYIEINEFALDKNGYPEAGGDMRSEQYKAIFDPNKTDALSLAQREFYNLYVKYYEDELLSKLDQRTKEKMTGRVPLVKSALLSDLKNKSNVFVRMYADTVRSVKNLVTETDVEKTVLLDENGDLYNGMPVFLTGSPRLKGELEEKEKKLEELKTKYKKDEINANTYKEDKSKLQGEIVKLRNKPMAEELSGDLATSLIKFSKMAEHYEVMGEIEDTLSAIGRVIENREYEPSKENVSLVGRTSNKIVQNTRQKIGLKKEVSGDSNIVKRYRKYMSMVYYDNELISKGAFDKIADKLISFSSLSYVGFNPFGNINNYLMGRINNNIEMLGSRFFSKKAYMRASKEWNTVALPGMIKRTGSGVQDLADIATLGLANIGKSDYDVNLPNNKYEAIVDEFRMMDPSQDIRESGRTTDSKNIWERFKGWGYVLQDAAEYNVQTKVGMSMVVDFTALNKTTNETLSLYDAFQFDGKTHTLKLMDGYDVIVDKYGNEKKYDDEFKYQTHNDIRQVNKQIHGNYAHEDRMVIQSYTLGKIAAQFKKWVAPAVRARFRKESFDENLGWMEGRYKSFLSFAAYAKKQIFLGNKNLKSYAEGYLKEQKDYDGTGGLGDSRGQNRLLGFYRTVGEIGIILSVYLINELFSSILAGDSDDSDIERRLKNLAKYQTDRLYKELIMFTPGFGAQQQMQMISDPFASAKMMGDIKETLDLAIWTSAGYIKAVTYGSEAEFYANKDYVYQNKPNKGRLKVSKSLEGILPIWRSILKWDNAIKEQEYQF
tara:strand:+ start:3576 stop:9521 length:5946 start_codon:yes stop_codon:yes gene_type:complete